jgi:hypothetical protein
LTSQGFLFSISNLPAAIKFVTPKFFFSLFVTSHVIGHKQASESPTLFTADSSYAFTRPTIMISYFYKPSVQLLLLGTGTAVGAFAASRPYSSFGKRTNRVYIPVRFETEFEPLTLLKSPLLANFSIHNDRLSTTVSKDLAEIVVNQTETIVSAVDVEADELGVRELLTRYGVTHIPTIVALKGGVPFDRYEVKNYDYEDLKRWVDKVGDVK